MEFETARAESLESWESVAPGWERRARYVYESARDVSDWLAEKLDPQPGQTILELACGIGDTGFVVAKRLQDRGRLISSDFSPRMVARPGAELRRSESPTPTSGYWTPRRWTSRTPASTASFAALGTCS